MITPDAISRGRNQIQKNYENAFKIFPKDSITFVVDRTMIQGNIAYIVWHARTLKFEMPLATDTFIIENDKIKSQTYAGFAR